jgi:multiple sugar transport system permease protein
MRTRPGVRAAQYVALLGYVVFLGFPLFWLLSTAFKPPAELSQLTPTLFPQDWTLSNFTVAFSESQLPGALRNSFVVAVATSIVTATSPSAGSSSARSSRSSSSSSPSSSSSRRSD